MYQPQTAKTSANSHTVLILNYLSAQSFSVPGSATPALPQYCLPDDTAAGLIQGFLMIRSPMTAKIPAFFNYNVVYFMFYIYYL